MEQTSRSEHFRLAKVLVETILRTKKNPRNKHFGRERVNFGKVPPFRTVHYGLLSPATGFGLQIWQIFLANQETSKTLPLIAPTMLPSQDKANGDSIQRSGTDNVEVVNSKVSLWRKKHGLKLGWKNSSFLTLLDFFTELSSRPSSAVGSLTSSYAQHNCFYSLVRRDRGENAGGKEERGREKTAVLLGVWVTVSVRIWTRNLSIPSPGLNLSATPPVSHYDS